MMPASDTDKLVAKVMTSERVMGIAKYVALLLAVFLTGSAGVKLTAPDQAAISEGKESVSELVKDVKAMRDELTRAVLTIESIAKNMDKDKAELERRILGNEKQIEAMAAEVRDLQKRIAKLEK